MRCLCLHVPETYRCVAGTRRHVLTVRTECDGYDGLTMSGYGTGTPGDRSYT